MLYDNTLTIDGEAFEIVAQAGEYDYQWNESALLRSPAGRLYYVHSSGCSCYGFADNVNTLADLTPVETWQDAVRLAMNDLAIHHATTFAERLGELRPVNA